MARKNKPVYYRGKCCMKNIYRDLKKHATKIISYEKKIPLANEEIRSYRKQKDCYTCKKDFSTNNHKKSTRKSEIIIVFLLPSRCS